MMTPVHLRRITTFLAFCGCAYVLVLFGLSWARAAEPIVIEDGNLPDSLSVGQIIAEAGLNGDKYKACKGDIFRLFEDNLGAKLEKVATDLIRDSLEQYTRQSASYLVCRAESYLNNLCIFTAAGGGCQGGGNECVKPIASDVTSFLKLNYKDRLKSAFLASCTSLYALKFTGDTVDAMIHSQGPGGAPAYATDWVTDANVRPAQQAQRRTWSILANTDICPYFREQALNYFGVPQSYRDTPPTINSQGLRVDERPPFALRAACTLPRDFDPSDNSEPAFLKNGGYLFLSMLNESQNNLLGFIAMAQEEMDKQKTALVQATQDQLVAGGGFLPVYGNKDDGCNADPDGNCITDGRIKQPPGAVQDIVAGEKAATYEALLKADGENWIGMTDLGARLQVRILDLANTGLSFALELGPESRAENFTPIPTPTPTSDPNDPACTGGDPRCTCVRDDPSAQRIARSVVSGAMSRAMQSNPELFVNGTNQIAPGTDFRLVLQAICSTLGSACIPHPGQDDEIVLRGADGLTISFDVITSDGFVRTNGGQPIAQCEAGVQD